MQEGPDSVPPADLSHAGAVVDKAIEYMMSQNIGSLAIASALLGGAMALLARSVADESIIRILDSAIASVRDGRLWKIEGNPLDPLSRGRLCPRGTGGVGAHFDPDRLRTPLIRVSERGEEKWKAVTWDEALNFIAGKMQKIKIILFLKKHLPRGLEQREISFVVGWQALANRIVKCLNISLKLLALV